MYVVKQKLQRYILPYMYNVIVTNIKDDFLVRIQKKLIPITVHVSLLCLEFYFLDVQFVGLSIIYLQFSKEREYERKRQGQFHIKKGGE